MRLHKVIISILCIIGMIRVCSTASVPLVMLASAAYGSAKDMAATHRYMDDSTKRVYTGGKVDAKPINIEESANAEMDRKWDAIRRYLESYATTEFAIDFGAMQFVPFRELWTNNFNNEEYKPLQSIVSDIITPCEVGSSIPYGVYYKDDIAYTLRYLDNFTYIELKIYDISEQAAKHAREIDPDAFNSDYQEIDSKVVKV